ncbi:MAG: NYN domain-containing protein [Terriglobia bacterium]|jgi:uncharacterized LabA/DUF88 family protein
MAEERLKLAVFIDFDNIQIGVKDTLAKEFDVAVVLEALKERGEVVSKTAYGDWSRAGEYGRQLTQHAVQMVQRNVTPRGDKNGADINLALDALEMAFTRDHINAFAIVGGDSDFIALVEKLKQYDKRVFVVGGRQFTSGILQRNCHEFIAYENLLEAATAGDGSRAARTTRSTGRGTNEIKPLPSALPNIQRALKILAEREVAPQLGLLKSTLLQLDATFTERDYGAGSFLEFIRKLEKENLIQARRTDRGYLVEMIEGEGPKESPVEAVEPAGEIAPEPAAPAEVAPPPPPETVPEPGLTADDTFALLKRALATLMEKAPSRPIYLRQVRQAMRSADARFDERQAGFRGLLDLLHQAQREGWLRLHRDRKGIWRIFATSAETARPPVTPEAVPEAPAETLAEPSAETYPEAFPEPVVVPEAEFAPPETDVLWEAVESPDEIIILEPTEAAPLAGEPPASPVEAVAERKPRRAQGARHSAKKAPRKTGPRRKPKEPKEVPF